MKKYEKKIDLTRNLFFDLKLSLEKATMFFVDLNKLFVESLEKLQKCISALNTKRLEVDSIENPKEI